MNNTRVDLIEDALRASIDDSRGEWDPATLRDTAQACHDLPSPLWIMRVCTHAEDEEEALRLISSVGRIREVLGIAH